MDQIEIETTAIETNVRTLIKTHPDPKQFIETLRNEAIDQAFQEISESIEILAERIQDECANKSDILKVLNLDSKLNDMNNRIFILEQTVKHNKRKE